MWSSGHFEVARVYDVGRQCWAIRVSLTIEFEARQDLVDGGKASIVTHILETASGGTSQDTGHGNKVAGAIEGRHVFVALGIRYAVWFVKLVSEAAAFPYLTTFSEIPRSAMLSSE